MNTIGKVGPYVIFTMPDETIQPGHQWIGINASNLEAAFVLAVLTDSEPHIGQEAAIVDGIYCRLAPHNQDADKRLRDLLDLVADLRFKAPQMLQIPIRGLSDEHA